MDLNKWNTLCDNRWNLSYLRTLLYNTQHDKLFSIPIKLQINSVVLLLCINRNTPYLPKEIRMCIYEHTQDYMAYFRPKRYKMDNKSINISLPFAFVPRVNLHSQFKHCIDKFGLVNFGNNDIDKLIIYLKIGIVGRYYETRIEYIYYIIIDINYEYQTISIIEGGKNVWVRTCPLNEARVRTFTFDQFILLGYKCLENKLSNMIIELKYSIENIV